MERFNEISEERRKFIRDLARALARKIAAQDYAAELASAESVG